jgi:signal transduction histidine kinase
MREDAGAVSIERWAGLITWGLLSVIVLWLYADDLPNGLRDPRWFISVALLLGFIVLFALATRDRAFQREPQTRTLLVCLQLVFIYPLYWLTPYNFLAILLTMWSAQLPIFMTVRKAALVALAASAVFGVIYQWRWQMDDAWLSALLFWAFHLFAITMTASQLREQRSREREQQLNRELRATQALLSEASRQQERTRIARNIHDLLGHHLTALSIHLQVAERQSAGEAQQMVRESQRIAKLLLADVREAVAELRDNEQLDIRQALNALTGTIDGRVIRLQMDSTVQVTDVEIADAIVKAAQEGITNFLRHSRGNAMTIAVMTQADRGLLLELRDNGSVGPELRQGNGLQGMHERFAAVGGECHIDTREGLCIRCSIPTEAL